MANLTYSEKLRDPRWQKKRLEIMERDDWSCTVCGDKSTTLNVHHKVYSIGADPWDYENKALTTLCEFCHGAVHEKSSSHDAQFEGVHSLWMIFYTQALMDPEFVKAAQDRIAAKEVSDFNAGVALSDEANKRMREIIDECARGYVRHSARLCKEKAKLNAAGDSLTGLCGWPAIAKIWGML